MPAGRYAPSPTGSLHLGNLRTAVAAYASARSRKMRFLLRIEDLDTQRCRPEYEKRHILDLKALCITWDESPIRQSTRTGVYAGQFRQLQERGLVYPCFCSRKDVAEVLSAPQGGSAVASAYPGTCARLPPSEAQSRVDAGDPHCWRLRMHKAPRRFLDRFVGEVIVDIQHDGGDFIVRRADGLYSYQFACAIDDSLSGVTEVVRGGDLLDSGLRQAYVLSCLGLPVPAYCHIPLMLGTDGKRFAKRAGDDDLAAFLAKGYDPNAILGYIAHTLGHARVGERPSIEEIIRRWNASRIPREPVVFDEALLKQFRPVRL